MTGDQVLSDDTIGINLNGRRYGYDYTTIIAWDDEHYQYVGLKVEDGRVVPCPLSEAQDFYFAILEEKEGGDDELTTVDTVDNGLYGITMRMIDFNNPLLNNRDSAQSTFFNGDNNNAGLLTTYLDGDYPRSTVARTGHDLSLAELFAGATDVNQLFIQSVYNESGYFEYDSTQNFATLIGPDGQPQSTFIVYDQLAAIGTEQTKTRTHGQFMPYNIIEPGLLAVSTNRTNVLGQQLPESDPRYDEKLYLIPQNDADYFFGMEMEASFTQTASGLDAWGHDIIFEFSGDDDFWLYVDGELILDLGGVHSAMVGSVNFRTGVVTSSRGNSTLYQLFRSHYAERGMTADQISAKLDEIFQQNENGQYVFKDYTNHTMKMFYMERGAGASNLKMRFNLASVKPGTVLLSKTLSGAESDSYDLVEFPYQIWYTSEEDAGLHLLTKDTPGAKVLYAGTTAEVPYAASFTTVDGIRYEDVFFLKPGQTAEIELPKKTIDYYVIECGVNTDIYDAVTVYEAAIGDGALVTGTYVDEDGAVHTGTYPGTSRSDYRIGAATIEARPQVIYDNHVREGAMRTLSITKRLYAEDGETLLHYTDDDPALVDDSVFTFRLYLGSENADADALPLANMFKYCVRDRYGEYCTWDAEDQCFLSLGKNEYDELTDTEKEAATFVTSMNGSISRIPADYTVEVRNLIVSTQYKVEERSWEIPKGYTLRVLQDAYTRVDVEPEDQQRTPYSGVILVDEDPKIEVRNQKGWGLTVEKVWSDKDFMARHDDIYFAVYLDGELVEGTVRRLKTDESEIYYFFPDLYDKDGYSREFAEFVIREVEVAAPEGGSLSVDDDGVVTGYASVTPLEGEDPKLTIGGQPVGGVYRADGFTCSVIYQPGEETTKNENVRTDTVTNSRPGIELYKTDWDGADLSGAVFTLVDENGDNVAAATYTSDSSGLITIAYLSEGSYTLREIAAPRGYLILKDPLTITVDEDYEVTVNGGAESEYYTVVKGDGTMAATITIKDRPAALQIRKVDAESGQPIAGVRFDLYGEVADVGGTMRKAPDPKKGYTGMITDANGVLREIGMDLGAGTYYLTETRAAGGYALLQGDVIFTIGSDGSVTVAAGMEDWLTTLEGDDGSVSYVISVPNVGLKPVAIRKVCMGTDTVLAGASFALYRAEDYDDAAETPIQDAEPVMTGTTGADGRLTLGVLDYGQYRLVETAAPDGYVLKEKAIRITVSASGVTYDEGTSISVNGTGVTFDRETGTYTLTISNSSGYVLPATGGRGTGAHTLIGALLAFAAGVLLCAKKRRPA